MIIAKLSSDLTSASCSVHGSAVPRICSHSHVRRAKVAPHPRLSANPRFAIIHFIKPWSKHCMVPAGRWLRLQIVHTTPALRQGFHSPFPTLNDIDFIFSAYSDLITWVEWSGNYMHLSEANFIETVVKMDVIPENVMVLCGNCSSVKSIRVYGGRGKHTFLSKCHCSEL